MKQVTITVPDKQFAFFMRLVRSLSFVQILDEQVPKTPHSPEFIAKIQKCQQEAAEGNVTRVKKDDLAQFLGL